MMNTSTLRLYAAAAFGLEGPVSGELKRLGMKKVHPDQGGVECEGSLADAFLCNLRLRCSDRVYILLSEGECLTFDQLFQLVSVVPWEAWISGTEKIKISAQCARSQLMSPRDCQSITKKAIIEHLRKQTGRAIFPESGEDFPVHIHIHGNRTRILLNTSGASLSRRGYRTWNGEAPLRETLAAALVEMSPWRPGMPLYDPCCGTGTLLIEAAMRQAHLAPGLHRSFAMEHFVLFPAERAEEIRHEAAEAFEPDRIEQIAGSDLDPSALELARRHEKQAALSGRIVWKEQPLQEVSLESTGGVFLCNPPYGERIGSQNSCRMLYADLSRLQIRHPTWYLCAISSDPGFERAYGRRADKKRRIYNGRLECEFYTYAPLQPLSSSSYSPSMSLSVRRNAVSR